MRFEGNTVERPGREVQEVATAPSRLIVKPNVKRFVFVIQLADSGVQSTVSFNLTAYLHITTSEGKSVLEQCMDCNGKNEMRA